MIDLSRRSSVGDTVAEYLERLPGEIDSDGEALWRIVPAGRYFSFSGDELDEFVRLCVRRLLDAGAVPVVHSEGGPMEWSEQRQYGGTRDEIVDGIVADWHRRYRGEDIPAWDWLWFVTPSVLWTAERLEEPVEEPKS